MIEEQKYLALEFYCIMGKIPISQIQNFKFPKNKIPNSQSFNVSKTSKFPKIN